VNQCRFAEEMTDYAYYKAKKLKKVLTNNNKYDIIIIEKER
jgi:hypothetical protein